MNASMPHGKWIYLAQRNARLTREEFFARWLKHRTLGAPPEMGAQFVTADYCAVQSGAMELDGMSDEYDGVGVFALNDPTSIPVVARFLKLDYIQADEKRFFNATSESFSIYGMEDVVRDGDEGEAAVLHFVRRAPTVAHAEFFKMWRADCERVLCRDARIERNVARLVLNSIIAPPPPGYGYDMVMETRFVDLEAAQHCVSALNALWRSSAVIDRKNSFVLATRIIAARPRKT